jgi:hypothetical protein
VPWQLQDLAQFIRDEPFRGAGELQQVITRLIFLLSPLSRMANYLVRGSACLSLFHVLLRLRQLPWYQIVVVELPDLGMGVNCLRQ